MDARPGVEFGTPQALVLFSLDTIAYHRRDEQNDQIRTATTLCTERLPEETPKCLCSDKGTLGSSQGKRGPALSEAPIRVRIKPFLLDNENK